jgi:hypothetical protein
MSVETLVVAVDASRARIFRVQREPDERHPIRLLEIQSVVHPEARTKQTERYGSGSPFRSKSGPGHANTFDDHRQAHDRENLKRFAQEIVTAMKTQGGESAHLIITTTHHMHQLLESEVQRLGKRKFPPSWLIAERTMWSPHDLCDDLVQRDLLR